MIKLLRRFKRVIRRFHPNIVTIVMCPGCYQMVNTFEAHRCGNPKIVEADPTR
ncbi:MAG TPA: hypothetical protein VHV10_17895 [Ktedonobacteraceae bacterium]|nr:hypothetical protein [Ktedonobacteraceae bacterium]